MLLIKIMSIVCCLGKYFLIFFFLQGEYRKVFLFVAEKLEHVLLLSSLLTGFLVLGIGATDNQTEQVLNDTFSYQNVQYKIILKNFTWNDAMAACINHKMQLVSITDQFQQASLAVQAALHDYPLWIGLFSRDVS